jgi:signal transduction histidine kinase
MTAAPRAKPGETGPSAMSNALLVVLSALLLAALAFLYLKTEAIDLREKNEVLALLRELKEIDSRWDVDVLRVRSELTLATQPAVDRAQRAAQALDRLARVAQSTDSRALDQGLAELRKAFAQKAELVEAFARESASARRALQAGLGMTADAAAWAHEARRTGPGRKERSALAETAAKELDGSLLRYHHLPDDAQRRTLDAAAAEFVAAAGVLPAVLGDVGGKMAAELQKLYQHRPVEEDLYAKLAFLTAGPRVDTLTGALNREVEQTLAEKEQFRVYLVYYALALLILIGYLGARLRATNIGLEQRVAERTRELSDALKQLKESEAQLIQSEKMSSLGQMVAGVAHEINTPLAYVKNSLGSVKASLPEIESTLRENDKLLALLSAENVDERQLNEQFARVRREAEQIREHDVLQGLSDLVRDGLYGIDQIAELVTNLKDFSRLDRSKVASFNLNDGLTSTLSLARHLLKSIEVRRQFGKIPDIKCSPSQVNQVLLNLVTNAAQAVEGSGGVITLTTRAVDSSHVAVDVADNGKGIPPEVLPKIFDPFFTTKGPGRGTGLGLSIAYKIVTEHGGKIDVASKIGVGTKFTVTLPLALPAQPAAA